MVKNSQARVACLFLFESACVIMIHRSLSFVSRFVMGFCCWQIFLLLFALLCGGVRTFQKSSTLSTRPLASHRRKKRSARWQVSWSRWSRRERLQSYFWYWCVCFFCLSLPLSLVFVMPLLSSSHWNGCPKRPTHKKWVVHIRCDTIPRLLPDLEQLWFWF